MTKEKLQTGESVVSTKAIQLPLFKMFAHAHVPSMLEESEEIIKQISDMFCDYLCKKLDLGVLKKVLPKSKIDIIANFDNPLRNRGFHPAYVLHFYEFVKQLHQQNNG